MHGTIDFGCSMHEIITTIGPSSFDKDIIESLKDADATDFN